MRANFTKKSLLILVWVLLMGTINAQVSRQSNENPTRSDRFEVKRGVRPVIDIKALPTDAYESGKILIKLNANSEIAQQLYKAGKDGYVKTGISTLDKLNQSFGASTYVPMLHGMYEKSSAMKKQQDRHRAWGFHLWFEVSLNQKANIVDATTQYAALKEVEIAEPVYKIRLVNEDEPVKWTPDDPRYNEQWHYHNTGQANGTEDKDIDLPEAWEIEKGHSDVIVAIVDGGIEVAHPDLSANIWSGVGYNFVTNSATLSPVNHGTHVAGTVAAVNGNDVGVSGVAGGSGSGDGVRLMSCQVFTSSSSGGFEDAPVYAADNGAAISQNSWGYTTAGVFNQNVLDAIDYFKVNGGGDVMEGGITIFAAGNSNADGSWYPGCYENVVAVAAMNNRDQRSYYSNYDTWVDVSAPGGETSSSTAGGVLSTLTGSTYGFYQGTSMACPHVSGEAALVLSYAHRNGLTLSEEELWDILVSATDNHYAQNTAYVGKLGSGRINAFSALGQVSDILSGVVNPSGVSAMAMGKTSISVIWTKNSSSNNVMVAYSTNGNFGAPVSGTSYSVGQTIPGGGQIIYKGSATSYLHNGLESATNYSYKLFSYDASNEYSSGRTANATTACDVLSLPYYESFESGIVPSLCWSSIDNDGDGANWFVGRTGGYIPQDGDHVAVSASWASDPLTPDNWLVTPQLHIETNSANLKYWVMTQDKQYTDEHYSILVSTTGSNVADFTEIYSRTLSASDTVWTEELVTLAGYGGQDVYIAFRHHNSTDMFQIVLDNMSVEEIVPGQPTVAYALSPSNNATDFPYTTPLTWKWGAYTDTYDLYFGTEGNMVKVVSDGTADESGVLGTYAASLAPSTAYQWKIVSKNVGTGKTAETAVYSFTTSCDIVSTLPMLVNFNDSDQLPSCWQIVDNVGNGQQWQIGTFAGGMSGTTGNYIYIDSESYGYGQNQNTDLITPIFDLTDYTDIQVDFNHYYSHYESSATFYYSTDDGLTWIQDQQWVSTTSNPKAYSKIFADLAGEAAVRFKWTYIGSWGFSWNIDDIQISGTANTSCDAPSVQASNFSATGISDNNLTVNWLRGNGDAVLVVARENAAVDATPFNGIVYDADATFGAGSEVGSGNFVVYNGSGESVVLSGLMSGTVYHFAIYEYNSAENCLNTNALVGNATTTGTSACEYCASNGSSIDVTGITYVGLNTIDNVSESDLGYTDFTHLSTTVEKNGNYDLSVRVNTNGNYTNYVKVWIDWNRNCEFDAEEEYDLGFVQNVTDGAPSASPFEITVPADAVAGTTTMRVSSRFGGAPTACATFTYGEVEDYSIMVLDEGANPQYTATFNVTSNATPVSGAAVVVNGVSLSTNTSGIASLNLENGTYGYAVSKTGYESFTGECTINNSATTVSVSLVATGAEQYQVQFSVTDGSVALAGANIAIDGTNLTTNSLGIATIDLVDGVYDYTVTLAGYTAVSNSVTVAGAAVAESVTMLEQGSDYYTVPFTENFDGVSAPALPENWVAENNNGDAYTWKSISTTAASSPNSLRIQWNSDLQMDDWAISRAISLETGKNYTVTFKYRGYSASYQERMKVFLLDEQTGDVNGEMLLDLSNIATGEFQTAEISDITVASSGMYYVGFYGYSEPDKFYLYLDDFSMSVSDVVNPQYTVTFNVTDGATAINGASVVINGETLTTNASGQATIDLENGSYNYTVTKNGFEEFNATVTVNDAVENVSVTLIESAAPQYTVTFNVTDGATAIIGASVAINGETLTTNASGQATIDLENGSYNYTVTKNGFEEFSGSVTVNDAVENVSVTLIESAAPQYTVTFNVTDGATAIDGASVVINGETLITNASGAAIIDLENGSYNYTVTKNGFDEFNGSVTVNDAVENVSVTLIESAAPQYTVTFNVTDGATAIIGASVVINGETLTTNASGAATIDLENGSYNYIVTKNGFDEFNATVTVDNSSMAVDVILNETSNDYYTVPFVESFDNEVTPDLPEGWAVENNNADAYSWETSTSNPFAGANSLKIRYNTDLAMDDWAVSKGIMLEAGHNYSVSFYYRSESSYFTENLTVYLLESQAANTETGVELVDLQEIGATEYQLATIDNVTVSSTGLYYIGFHGNSLANMYNLYVDELAVNTATAVDTYTVTFNVTDGTTAIEGAFIDINNETLTADGTGVATIDLENGSYNYIVTKNGFDDFNGTVTVNSAAENVSVTLNESTAPQYAVTFNVTDGSIAIEGALVAIDGETLTTTSSGMATIDLEDGSYDYTVNKNGYEEATGNVNVSGGAVTENVSLQTIAGITFSTSVTDVTCNGGNDGQITFSSVAGGSGTGYAYSVDAGTTWHNDMVVANLEAGSYTVVVKDSEASMSDAEVIVIEQPEEITGYTINTQNVSIFGGSDGSIEITGTTGGTGTYQYSIDNGNNWQASNLFENLTAGTYNIVIMDENACQADAGSVTITQPNEETYTVTFQVTADGMLLEDASVSIGTETLTTNANGICSTELTDGSYNYTVTADNYDQINGVVEVNGADVTESISFVGVNDLAQQINIYPNPSKGQLFVDYQGRYNITLTTSLGSVIMQKQLENKQLLDLTNHSNGLYILSVETNAGVIINRVIISR